MTDSNYKETYKEENVTINGEIILRGSLTIPKSDTQEKFPAVLLLPGSGRVDRNENNPSLRLNVLKYLAETFTNLGYVTLRYDKRGVGESSGEYIKAGLWDLVDDAEHALRFLKQQKEVDESNVLICGHSEGAIIAPILNERDNVQGLILLAGTAESLQKTMIRQNERVLKEMENQQGMKGLFYRLLGVSKKGKKDIAQTHKKILESTTATLEIKGKKVNAKWMREHFQYNVAKALENVNCPTLVITGSKDIQVPPEQVNEIIKLVRGSTESYIIEGMNHILRQSGDASSMMDLQAEYKKMEESPLHEEFLEKITNWLKKLKK